MPLFGSKNNNDTTSTSNTVGGGRHHMQPTTDTQGLPGSGLGGAGDYNVGTHTGTGPGTGLGHNIGGMGATHVIPPGSYNQHPGGAGQFNDASMNSGPGGAVGGMHQGGGRGIPPTDFVNHDASGAGAGMGAAGSTGGGGGAGQRLTGKAERVIGNLVGSAALQEKGAQKEREAAATKLQGRELAEAERLESEALMRRERAVGHGAHPANSSLGGGNIGAGGGIDGGGGIGAGGGLGTGTGTGVGGAGKY